MQLSDDELDKKLKQLKRKDNELRDTAKKIDIQSEKEKYRKIKAEVKENQAEMALLKEEKEKRQREKGKTVAEQTKEIEDAKTKERARAKEEEDIKARARAMQKEEQAKEEAKAKEEEEEARARARARAREEELIEARKREAEKEAEPALDAEADDEAKERADDKEEAVDVAAEEIDYDKQIGDLEIEREKLYKQAKKTDRKTEIDKYRQIKQALKENKKQIELLEEARDKEKKVSDKNANKHVLMQLQLGDVIQMHDPTNKKVNGYKFFVNYIDETLMKLINLSSMTLITLKINKDKTIENDTIDLISLLYRNKTPSYARQNNLLPGTWINIYFEGDLPKIETGEITNLEQDMIEIKLFPSNNVIYLNFEYKGMPENIKITIRQNMVNKLQRKEPGQKQPGQPEGQEQLGQEQLGQEQLGQEQQGQEQEQQDTGLNKEDNDEREIEIEAQPVNIATTLHKMILKANQVEFGKEEFGSITQFIDVDISNQRYSLDAQLNDLMDDLFATVPSVQRKNYAVLNNIHTTVERFKQLREQFSMFDEYGNILYETVKKANWKPLSLYFEKFDVNLYWILPVVKSVKKIFITEESDNVDIDVISEEPYLSINEIVNKYKSATSSEEENKYSIMFKELDPILRPFEYTHHENQQDVIAKKKVHTNILAIVNNNDNYVSYVSRGKGSTSPNGEQNVIGESLYLRQQYNGVITQLHKENGSGNQLIVTKKPLIEADELEIKSIMTFPEPVIRFSRINLPGTNVLIKSNLNSSFFKYWDFFTKRISIQEKMAHAKQEMDNIKSQPLNTTLGIDENETISIKLLITNQQYAQAQVDSKSQQLATAKINLAEAESDLKKADPYTTQFEKKINHEISLAVNTFLKKIEDLKQQMTSAQTKLNKELANKISKEITVMQTKLSDAEKDLADARYLEEAQKKAEENNVPYSEEIKKKIQRARESTKNKLKKNVDRLKQKLSAAQAEKSQADEELASAQARDQQEEPNAKKQREKETEKQMEAQDDEYEFAKKITNYKIVSNAELTPDENYAKYIDAIIPNIKIIFNIMKKYINAKLSIVDVVSYLEPFLIYTDDLTYAQYKEITNYIDEQITDYNKSFTSNMQFFNQYIKKHQELGLTIEQVISKILPKSKTRTEYLQTYNPLTARVTSNELLMQMTTTDFGNLFNTMNTKENMDLMFPNDVTHVIENIEKQFEEEEQKKKTPNKCASYIFAKKYYTLEELENDNGKNIYFDRQFDDTYYGILDKYEKERSKMSPEEFFIFLQGKLKSTNKLNDVDSHYLTETVINGMRSVLDGYYAILIIGVEYTYYIRKNNQWVITQNIDPTLITTSANIRCNLQLNCISNINTCNNTENAALTIKQNFIKQALGEFDEKIAISKEAFTKMVDKKLEYYNRILPKIIEIEKARFMQYNNMKYTLGMNNADESEIIVSPHAPLLRHILGMNDTEMQQVYIIKFVKMFTEPNFTDPHWLYCKTTHVKLIPQFLHTMAFYYNTPYYQDRIDELKLKIGKFSDDGDAWVDKHSGYVIEKINFNVDESYEEGQQRIKRRDEMSAAADEQKSGEIKPKLNKQSQLISNIVTTLSREMGINIESERDFIITTVNVVIQEHLKKESEYAKMIKEKANKGVIIASYPQYYNDSILFATFGTFLVAVQCSIPSIQTRKTFPGCVKSFDGYPFNGESDFSALTYISCVGYNLRSNVEPWSVLHKKKYEYVYDKTKFILDTVLLKLSEIKRKINEKVEYLLKKPEVFISEEYSLSKWKEFLPPLVELHIKSKDTQYISDKFERDLLDNIKAGSYQTREKLLVLESKVIFYSLAIQEKIQDIIKKQPVLLQNFLENACCMDNKTLPMIEYFKEKDASIEMYNNNAIKLTKILDDIYALSKAILLSSRINSKLVQPSVLKIFNEDTIYLAFIHFCKFKTQLPMNPAFIPICKSKPAMNEKDKDNNPEIIRKLKLAGTEYLLEDFLRLLQLVNRENMVVMDLSLPVIEPLTLLREKMRFINETENDGGIALLIELLETENNESALDDAINALGDFLSGRVSYMKTLIIEYIKENSSGLSKKKYSGINKFIDSIMDNESSDDMDWKNSQVAFYKSYAQEISRGFPNIILKSINYTAITIPIYWKLSQIHTRDIQEFVQKYYSQLGEFYEDATVTNILNEIKESCDNLLMAINEIRYFTSSKERLTDRLVELLIQYFFLKIIMKYIDLSKDSNNVFHKKEGADEASDDEEREKEYEVQTRYDEITIDVNQKILKEKVAKLLIVYINIMMTDKNDNEFSYEDVTNMVFKIKQREKNDLTDKLKLKTDDERAVDTLFKKYKLGDWNKGMQKALTEYVAEDYDNTLEETEKYQRYEKELIHREKHGTNYNVNDDVDEYIEDQQMEEDIDNENRDMAHMNEDYMDGDYYGDEVGETMDEYD